MGQGPSVAVDAQAYVDESGVKGFIDTPGPKEFGLLLGIVVRVNDDVALRTALQPHFGRFLGALPLEMKPHITDAFASPDPQVRAVASLTRDAYEQVARQQPITVLYEAISADRFARRRDSLRAVAAQGEAARRSGTRITTHPHRDRIEEEILEGFLLKIDAFAEDSSLRHVAFLSDTLSGGVRSVYQATLVRVRSAANQVKTIKGYDQATKVRLTGSVQSSVIVPTGSGLEPAVTRLGDVADSSTRDALLLMADILANSLRHHLETTLNPDIDPLNAPSSIRAWCLEDKVYGATDDYVMDIL